MSARRGTYGTDTVIVRHLTTKTVQSVTAVKLDGLDRGLADAYKKVPGT